MAPFGKLPEVVTYTEFGRDHQALVIGSRELAHHSGENGELLLNLVIVKPLIADACANCGNRRVFHGKPAPAHLRVCDNFVDPDPQTSVNLNDLIHIQTDVPHESHEFTADQLKEIAETGVNTQQAYPGGALPGGRWRESGPVVIPQVVGVAGGAIEVPSDDKPSAEDLDAVADEQKAKADTTGEEPPPTVQ